MQQNPRIIYGSEHKGNKTKDVIQEAISLGFRAIDTANCCAYNEVLVGEALSELYLQGYQRQDLWLQSKFTFTYDNNGLRQGDPDAWLAPNHDTDVDVATQVWQSFNSTLEHLHANYLDSFILHAPYHISNYDIIPRGVTLVEEDFEAWKTMETFYDLGLVKSLGVSNFSPKQLNILLDIARVKPRSIQNIAYSFDSSDFIDETLAICKKHSIEYQGFSDGVSFFKKDLLVEIAEKYNISVIQASMKLAIQRGITPMTETANPKHMVENIAVLDLEDIQEIDQRKIYEHGHIQMLAYVELCGDAELYPHTANMTAFDLAKNFTMYSQIMYLQLFGPSQIEEALAFRHNDIVVKTLSGYEALKEICKEGDALRLPTKVDADLANKFISQPQLSSLKNLGADKAHIALKISSIYGASTLEILCTDNTGHFRNPTEEEINFANQCGNYYSYFLRLQDAFKKEVLDLSNFNSKSSCDEVFQRCDKPIDNKMICYLQSTIVNKDLCLDKFEYVSQSLVESAESDLGRISFNGECLFKVMLPAPEVVCNNLFNIMTMPGICPDEEEL